MTDQSDEAEGAQVIGSFQRELSVWNARFMEIAMRDERFRKRGDAPLSFEGLKSHSWPTFVDTGKIQEWVRVSLAMRGLILNVGLALLPSKADEIANLFGYSLQHASIVAHLLAKPDRRYGFASKTDFLLSQTGLKCCELDFGDVGLWHLDTFTTMFRNSAIANEFASQNGVRVRERHPLRTAVAELVRQVAQRGPVRECNCAILIPDDTPAEEFEAGRMQAAFASYLYQAALRALGFEGTVMLERANRLDHQGDHASIDGKRIDVVMTQAPDLSAEAKIWTESSLSDLVMRDHVIAVNGPDCSTISSKVVLALISEAADTGRLTPEDTALVQSTLPWTRRIAEKTVQFQGRDHSLPELLFARQETFVLKPGEGFGSESSIRIGRNTPRSEWERTISAAVDEGSWVAQEAVGGTPIWFLDENGNPSPHGVNIGIVMCGSEYAGIFLRLMPDVSPDQISAIGYAGGAITGGVVEVAG
jgi:hypothetical protein